jgi:hypothetical protein
MRVIGRLEQPLPGPHKKSGPYLGSLNGADTLASSREIAGLAPRPHMLEREPRAYLRGRLSALAAVGAFWCDWLCRRVKLPQRRAQRIQTRRADICRLR